MFIISYTEEIWKLLVKKTMSEERLQIFSTYVPDTIGGQEYI